MSIHVHGLATHFDLDAIATLRRATGSGPYDPSVGIRPELVKTVADGSFYRAVVKDVVRPHVHLHGNEDYYILQGRGLMHMGRAVLAGPHDYVVPAWEVRRQLPEGDHFVVPQGYAHSLENIGDGPLVLLFKCVAAHLDDTRDRFLVRNLPVYQAHRVLGDAKAPSGFRLERHGLRQRERP